MKYKITCRFCSHAMGEIDFPGVPEGAVIPREQHSVGDARCDTCVQLHGNFSQMWKVYDETMLHDIHGGNTNACNDGFNSLALASAFKADEFLSALIILNPNVAGKALVNSSDLEARRNKILKGLGIDTLGENERVDAVKTMKARHQSIKFVTNMPADSVQEIKREIINKRRRV